MIEQIDDMTAQTDTIMKLIEPEAIYLSVYSHREDQNIGPTKAVVLVLLFLLCVALWFLLRGVSCWVLPCSLFSCCFVSHFSIVITSLGFESCVRLRFLLVSGVGCSLWWWHSLSLSFINLLGSFKPRTNALEARSREVVEGRTPGRYKH